MIGSTKVCICEKVFFIIMNAWVEKIVLHRTIGMYEMSPKKYVQNYECTPPYVRVWNVCLYIHIIH
jgi:hypothetical protein